MHVCHLITKPELGGAQLSTLNILSGLKRDKYRVSVITSPRGILRPEFENLKDVSSFFSPFLVRHINPLLDILAFIHIYLIYKSHKYNIVHTHSSKAGIIGRWAARLAGVPVIVHTVHGWSFNEHQGRIKRNFFVFLERITARFTSKIICVSDKDIKTGLRYKIATEDKLVFIKYGIPLKEFRKTSIYPSEKKKQEIGISNMDPVVGMISCLKPQKAPLDYVRTCIEIHHAMPNVNFLLIGDGVLRSKCKRLLDSSDLNGRFIFTGWRRDIPEILDILDVVVLTSKWEGMPISAIEALSKGRPVVATDAGGSSEIIEDGMNGCIVKIGSPNAIAEKILGILKNPQILGSMKKEASLSIDDSFEATRMVDEIECLYGRLS